MCDKSNLEQQHAVGILSTNLIYGAFNLQHQPEDLIESRLDNLSPNRIEVDLIKFDGPEFATTDNRIMNPHLKEKSSSPPMPSTRRRCSSNGVVFDLLQKSISTYSNAPRSQFIQGPSPVEKEIIVLAEITMSNLQASGQIDYEDFLHRIDSLGTSGNYTLISN
tara:strand:- start:605 stop:1096 length:492 start_codon:yes stop_codon:yes gene_type:complete